MEPQYADHADEALREVARRLLGRRPGIDRLTERLEPTDTTQARVWLAACTYIDGRLHSTPEEKPGRTPDLNPLAAAAMRSVLTEVGLSAISAATAASAPQWAAMHRALHSEGDGGMATQADGAAAAHSHTARSEAAARLVANHANVLRDVCNPSASTNIDNIPLTQLELKRVPTEHAHYADELLREAARRLLGRRPVRTQSLSHPGLALL